MSDMQAARALGWTSIGLGLTEIAAPRWLGNQLGVGDQRGVLRALGARELLSGAGILARRDPTAGLWARVAGDVMDLALLGAATRRSTRRRGVAGAIAAVSAIGGLDLLYAQRLRRARHRAHSTRAGRVGT